MRQHMQSNCGSTWSNKSSSSGQAQLYTKQHSPWQESGPAYSFAEHVNRVLHSNIRLTSNGNEIASGDCTTNSLAGTCAATAAIWRCESVLHSCQGAASNKLDMGKYHLAIPMGEMCAKSAEHLTEHFSLMGKAAEEQPEMASEAARLAASLLPAILEVVLTVAGLVIATIHDTQHGKPSGPLVNGASHHVPPFHETFLQAAGRTVKLPPLDAQQPVDPSDVLENCLPALNWGLQCLCRRLEGEVAAAGSQQEGCSSSSAGGAANFQSMRLLPHLPALLSELVALQPRLDVLSNVTNLSFKCLATGLQLRLAACGEQPSLSGSCTKAQGLAITKGLFGACLEVLVPVQQHLATHDCSVNDGAAIEGSFRQAPTGDVVTGAHQHADADPDVGICQPTAMSLEGTLYRVLAGSMTAFDHGGCHAMAATDQMFLPSTALLCKNL
jgi:hypothetical protein